MGTPSEQVDKSGAAAKGGGVKRVRDGQLLVSFK